MISDSLKSCDILRISRKVFELANKGENDSEIANILRKKRGENVLQECPANKGVPEKIAPENAGNFSRECPI